MDFFIKDKEDIERGPVSQETLLKWVAAGKVRPETLVRNSLLHTWKSASDFPFLEDPLKNQPEEVEDEAGFWESTGELLGTIKDKRKKAKKPESTAFEYKYLPAPATVKLRVMSFIFDMALLSVFGIVFYFLGVSAVLNSAALSEETESQETQTSEQNKTEETADAKQSKTEEQEQTNSEQTDLTSEQKDIPPRNNPDAEEPPTRNDDESKGYKQGSLWTDNTGNATFTCLDASKTSAVWVNTNIINSTFHKYFTLFMLIALLYYGLTLGYFAQTFGMWFWGIFIVKNDEDLSEVFFFRAYMFAVLMFIFGILSPVIVAINPKRRAIHDMLSGVRVLKIAGKPKA
ncbi:MAG: hypothetical protein A2017_16100 [Lentisphaerae bacterium GWF2_44_16]|nr:MAG: hypothetical protein A2017_16100 [Lentisphaerae bacterium GWF2_44_16]